MSTSMSPLRLGRLSEDAGHKGTTILTDELTDLDGQDLGRIHLLVQELYDSAQLRWDVVCDEHEAHAASLEVGLDV